MSIYIHQSLIPGTVPFSPAAAFAQGYHDFWEELESYSKPSGSLLELNSWEIDLFLASYYKGKIAASELWEDLVTDTIEFFDKLEAWHSQDQIFLSLASPK